MSGSSSDREGRIMSRKYKCHKISEGVAEGEAIISKDNIMFYLIDPATGTVIEPHHDIEGKSIAHKIIIFPGGKGSSVVQADGLYQLNLKGNSPHGMIIQYPETVLISSAIIMEIPMVDKVEPAFYEDVSDGDRLKINADDGYIEIVD
jgi:predicted aconitase with swiveling domain